MIDVDKVTGQYSDDRSLNHLLGSVVKEVKEFADNLTEKIRRLTEVGIALSAERDINRLLELIVDEARSLTSADAGTLYTVAGDHLHFQIMQNDMMKVRMGGSSGPPIPFPPVPMSKENVSSYVALTGEVVNIPDVYEAEGFDFTGPRKYDKQTGYRSKSMLVVPLRDHERSIIGVLQLLNALDADSGEIISFSPEYVDLVTSLASQAAIALTNARLIKDIEAVFESLVEMMAKAIDARSPYNASHTERVAKLGVLLAEAVNRCDDGPLAAVIFTEDELNELRISGWLHDIGKITTPEWVMDKPTKLTTIIDRDQMIAERFTLIKRDIEIAMQQEIIALHESGSYSAAAAARVRAAADAKMAAIDADIHLVIRANCPGEFMKDEDIAAVQAIAAKRYQNWQGLRAPNLTDNEVENLIIRKGSITEYERSIMQDHVKITRQMLTDVPFIKKLANVPRYAGDHHERLNGHGYPNGLGGEELPLQSRILAIVDFFEALTACDRPYKPSMPLERAFSILSGAVERGELDRDLFELFRDSKVYELIPPKERVEVDDRAACGNTPRPPSG